MWLWHMDVPDVRPLTTVRETFAMAPLPDGRRVLSASVRMTLWDLESGETLQRFEGHRLFVNSLAPLSDGRVPRRPRMIGPCGSGIWYGRRTAPARGSQAERSKRSRCCPTDRRAVSGSADFTLRSWDLDWPED